MINQSFFHRAHNAIFGVALRIPHLKRRLRIFKPKFAWFNLLLVGILHRRGPDWNALMILKILVKPLWCNPWPCRQLRKSRKINRWANPRNKLEFSSWVVKQRTSVILLDKLETLLAAFLLRGTTLGFFPAGFAFGRGCWSSSPFPWFPDWPLSPARGREGFVNMIPAVTGVSWMDRLAVGQGGMLKCLMKIRGHHPQKIHNQNKLAFFWGSRCMTEPVWSLSSSALNLKLCASSHSSVSSTSQESQTRKSS